MVRRKNQAFRAPQKAENGETLIVSEIERRTKIARLFSLLHALGRNASLFWFNGGRRTAKGFSPARTLGLRAAIYM